MSRRRKVVNARIMLYSLVSKRFNSMFTMDSRLDSLIANKPLGKRVVDWLGLPSYNIAYNYRVISEFFMSKISSKSDYCIQVELRSISII